MGKIAFIKNWFLSLKLKQKVKYLFLTIIGIYIILSFLIYSFVIRNNMFHYMKKSNYNTMVSIGNNLNTEIGNINTMSQLIMQNSNVTAYLKTPKEDSKIARSALTTVYDFAATFPYISSVYIFRTNGQSINVSNSITLVKKDILEDKSWYKQVEDAAGGYLIQSNGNGAFLNVSGKPLVSLVRIVNDIDTQKPIGMLVINLTSDILENTYKDVAGYGKSFYYYNENSEIICQSPSDAPEVKLSATDEIFQQKSISTSGKEKILSYYKIPDTPFIVAGLEDMSVQKFMPMESFLIIGIFLIITFLCLILINIFISFCITTPIERLVLSMGSVKDGWLRRVSIRLPDDEIGHLKNSYNNMLVEINRLIEELLEKEKSIQKAELLVLQEQIKPHFLYNTLDTIGYLALGGNGEDVYDAIETLGNFYRKFLSKGSRYIPLSEEIAIVKDYLKLQKLRYDDIFDDIYEIEKGCDQFLVPKLILQPLVENSLYHGIRLKGEKGMIRIKVYEKDDHYHVIIYDSGIGMNQEQISTLMDGDSDKNFGFKGTIERIQYYYHVEDVYEIKSQEGLYCEVHLKIPR